MGADETRIGELVHDRLQRAADGELAVRVNDGLIPGSVPADPICEIGRASCRERVSVPV